MGQVVEKLFKRYQHIPVYYADKIYDTHKISYERIDIIQELNIKLLSAIVSYGKKWAMYKKTGLYKPVRIEYYLKFCMINKIKDLIKKIERESCVSYHSDFTFDVGRANNSIIDFTNNKLTINDFDILQNMKDDVSKKVFKMYLKGYMIGQLKMIFRNKNVDVSGVINSQVHFLKQNKNHLFGRNPVIFQTMNNED
jgi:hypothetical protein